MKIMNVSTSLVEEGIKLISVRETSKVVLSAQIYGQLEKLKAVLISDHWDLQDTAIVWAFANHSKWEE